MPSQTRLSAVRPWFWHRLTSIACLVIGSIGFAWVNLVAPYTAPFEETSLTSSRPTAPERLTIPSVKIDQNLKAAALTEAGWYIAPAESNYLLDSARPGENSNVVVYGHNLWNMLGRLKNVKVGDQIKIETSDREIWYEITSKQVVWPTETRVIQPTDEETLTIFTCTGLFDSQRLVVQAKPTNSYYRTKISDTL